MSYLSHQMIPYIHDDSWQTRITPSQSMRSSVNGRDWQQTKAQTLTSLSHWSASQSQFHHHGREESLRLKFNTLKYQLSKPEPKFCLKKKNKVFGKPLSALGASLSRARPSKSSSMLRFLEKWLTVMLGSDISGHSSKWQKNEKRANMCAWL